MPSHPVRCLTAVLSQTFNTFLHLPRPTSNAERIRGVRGRRRGGGRPDKKYVKKSNKKACHPSFPVNPPPPTVGIARSRRGEAIRAPGSSSAPQRNPAPTAGCGADTTTPGTHCDVYFSNPLLPPVSPGVPELRSWGRTDPSMSSRTTDPSFDPGSSSDQSRDFGVPVKSSSQNRRGGVLVRLYRGSAPKNVSSLVSWKPPPSAARIARSRRGEAIRAPGSS